MDAAHATPETESSARAELPLAITGLSHLVVAVDDLDAARNFYGETLGFGAAPMTDAFDAGTRNAAFATADGGHLVLAEAAAQPDLRATGVHQAYRVGPAVRDGIARRLAARGTEVLTCIEDRPAEGSDGFYMFDPAGNRVQLVTGEDTGGVPALDHAAVQVADILWAERFYTAPLSLAVEHRVGWRTADYARAQAWAEGRENMAPGTRRMDKRYSSMAGKREVPRVNTQIFLRAGTAVLGVYLANRHFQEPPEEQLTGIPRTAFAVAPGALDTARAQLDAAGWAWENGPAGSGPIAASIRVRDPGGNFIELAVPAGA